MCHAPEELLRKTLFLLQVMSILWMTTKWASCSIESHLSLREWHRGQWRTDLATRTTAVTVSGTITKRSCKNRICEFVQNAIERARCSPIFIYLFVYTLYKDYHSTHHIYINSYQTFVLSSLSKEGCSIICSSIEKYLQNWHLKYLGNNLIFLFTCQLCLITHDIFGWNVTSSILVTIGAIPIAQFLILNSHAAKLAVLIFHCMSQHF